MQSTTKGIKAIRHDDTHAGCWSASKRRELARAKRGVSVQSRDCSEVVSPSATESTPHPPSGAFALSVSLSEHRFNRGLARAAAASWSPPVSTLRLWSWYVQLDDALLPSVRDSSFFQVGSFYRLKDVVAPNMHTREGEKKYPAIKKKHEATLKNHGWMTHIQPQKCKQTKTTTTTTTSTPIHKAYCPHSVLVTSLDDTPVDCWSFRSVLM